MYLTAAELKMVIDALDAMVDRHKRGTVPYRATRKLRDEFKDKYDTIRLLDIEAAKRS